MTIATNLLDDYQKLYLASSRFASLKPWEFVNEEDIFGIQDPKTGTIAYCSIMGHLGEFYSLAAYLGVEGLWGFIQVQKLSESENFEEQMLLSHPFEFQNSLIVSFEDRESQSKKSLKIIKELGLKFRGKAAWPLFRRYLPFHFPKEPNIDQIRFLAIILEQACQVLEKIKQDPSILTHPSNDENLLLRVCNDGVWENVWHIPEIHEMQIKPKLDLELLSKVQWQNLPHQGTWITDCSFTHLPLSDNQETCPFLAPILSSDGSLLNLEFISGDISAEFPKLFLQFCIKSASLPERVIVSTKKSFFLLQPLSNALSFSLELQEENAPILPFLTFFEEKMLNGLDDFLQSP